jgi:adenine/guanine phosphoribosyltransferase-like PRPP-binding protein
VVSCNFLLDGILGDVIQEKYELEYGTDCLEMHVGALQSGDRVVIIDDIVATGGTLSAAIQLVGKLAKCFFLFCLYSISIS